VSSENNPNPALGTGLGQHALRLSGRIVAGVGQLLLWVLTGIATLLRPLADWAGSRLYGRRPAATRGQSAARDGRTRLVDPAADTAPLPRWLNLWHDFTGAWWFAPLTGIALALAALAELIPHRLVLLSVAGGFALATTLPLVWRREYPRPVTAVILGAFAADLLSGQQLMITSVLAALYTLYALARHLDRQATAVLAVSATIAVLVVYVVSFSLHGIPVIAAVLAVIAAVGLGDARRVVETAERTEAAAHERNSETLSRLDEVEREQAVLRERARIARELHDVVAHSVSMIAVQAETAPYTMRDLSPEAAEGYREIAGTAREALVEMRRLLGVLRADAKAEPDTAPQPRLDRLPELIEKHRGAGGEAEMAVAGDPRALSATIELSAYRIVQEALTNARRHAPGSNVRVELTYLPDRLAVRVRDDGTGARGPAAAPGSAQRPGGHGLLGMRERATMLGGRFAAGPAAEGGFMVEAELPTKNK
jgi:signal transduction histidine kinase